MNRLVVRRDPFQPTHTTGIMTFPGQKLFTLERPWIGISPGGKPYDSCVPGGRYRLKIHVRPNGMETLVLINPGLAVFHHQKDRISRVGRYLCLIHPANTVGELQGCTAPGTHKGDADGLPVVRYSRAAMEKIMDYSPSELVIIDPL